MARPVSTSIACWVGAGLLLWASGRDASFECYPWPAAPAEQADVAFLGRVAAIDRTGASFFTGPETSVRFDILGYWHGVSDDTTTAYSTDHPEGLPVDDIGETWLIIANQLDDGRFWATVCDGSSQYESLRDAPLIWMLQQLGLDVGDMRRPA